MNRVYHIFLIVAIHLLMAGCSKSSFESGETKEFRNVKIAVVLSQSSHDRWSRIMELARKNISQATDICPIYEFYDEDSHDIMTLAYQLARDESVACIIGCEDDENTDILAYQLSRLKQPKPMFTFNTSQELIRKYARMGFMWGLSESDITLSEVILAQIAQDITNTNVALIANKSSSGQTFVDWFAFQATELGLTPCRIATYDHISEIAPILMELSDLNCPIVCAPRTPEEAAEMIMNTNYGYYSKVAFSDKTLEILRKYAGDEHLTVCGITPVSDPHSGFQDVYTARYGVTPIFGEAQLYDAIMTTCLAYAVAAEFDVSLNKAVSKLLEADGRHMGEWTCDAIQRSYEQIVNEHTIPAITGAIGDLPFSPDKHTIINYSTYAVQYLSDFKYYQTDYISRGEDGTSSSIYGAWIWNKIYDQEFDYTLEDEEIVECKGNKAVLIATSKGWDNYRHQADILAYYQLLKKKGYSDDDIVLIMADDIANNTRNPYPGQVIRDRIGLKNLYNDVVIDYHLDRLTPQDLKSILLGKSSDKLPVVLDSERSHNVLFIWSGHGIPGTMVWNENRQTINGTFLSELFNEMYAEGKYRRLFGIIETCYAGSVAKSCTGIPALLLMTAANEYETSKAESYDSLWGTYLTNSFTSAVLNTIETKPDTWISIRDLYYETFTKTMGSHVTLYNTECFGNMYFNYVNEFI